MKKIQFKRWRDVRVSSKLIIIFVLVACIPLCIVGLYSHKLISNLKIESTISENQRVLDQVSVKMQARVQAAIKEIEFLSGVPPIQGIIRARNNEGFDAKTNSTLDQWEGRLETICKKLLNNKKLYSQVTYLCEGAKQHLNVAFDGKSIRTRGKDVPSLSQEEFDLIKGSMGVYISDITDITIAGRKVPSITLGKKVYDKSKKNEFRGVLVLRIWADAFRQWIQEEEREFANYFLYGNDERLIYGDDQLGYSGDLAHQDWAGEQMLRADEHILIKTEVTLSDEISLLLVNSLDWSYINTSVVTFRLIFGGIIFVVLLLVVILGVVFSKQFLAPINKVHNALYSLEKGEQPEMLSIDQSDELGEMGKALNQVVEGQLATALFAEEIGKGNLGASFSPLSENDVLGKALLDMRASLKKVADEDEVRDWINKGITEVADLLQMHNENLAALSQELIIHLVKYVGAVQGGVFVLNDEKPEEQFMELKGAYAFDRHKHMQKKVVKGEGLVGACWIEGKRILMNNVPEDYATIVSGLGDTGPGCILIIPLVVNEEIMGVLELASFECIEDFQIEFLEKLGENIAATIKAVKSGENTERLLRDSEKMKEELQLHEEEMRQNMEEMQATQDAMHAVEEDLNQQVAKLTAELKQSLNEVKHLKNKE